MCNVKTQSTVQSKRTAVVLLIHALYNTGSYSTIGMFNMHTVHTCVYKNVELVESSSITCLTTCL